MLEVCELSSAYGDHVVLKNVGFTLSEGCVLAMIGPNGAGKSTLIRVLSGLTPLSSGYVRFDGRDLNTISMTDRAQRMAVVPQARNLPPAFTGWETVSMGRTPYLKWLGQLSTQDEEIVRLAMQQTDTLALADRPVGELSGGEQQRLLLARALAQTAPVLLLDEPTTHLDLQHQLAILDNLRRLAHPHPGNGKGGLHPLDRRLSVLVVLHDLNLVARFADEVALMVDGQLQALGKPDDVLTPELLSAAYHVPIEVLRSPDGTYPVIFPHIPSEECE
jgi:iron complex transport system ATP-binding protein